MTNKTIAAIEDAGFGAFARLLASDGAADALDSGTPFTIFAPTDIAFGKLAQPLAYRMMKESALRRAVAGFHIAAGKVMSKRFVGARIRAVTQQGQVLLIDGRDGVHVNGAKVVCPDITIGANVLHGIDAVLWPEPAIVTS